MTTYPGILVDGEKSEEKCINFLFSPIFELLLLHPPTALQYTSRVKNYRTKVPRKDMTSTAKRFALETLLLWLLLTLPINLLTFYFWTQTPNFQQRQDEDGGANRTTTSPNATTTTTTTAPDLDYPRKPRQGGNFKEKK